MKKTLLYLASALLLATSCDLNINEDPDSPSNGSVTPDLVFPSAQNALMMAQLDDAFNYAGFFAQYFEQLPTINQFNNLAEQAATLNETSQVIDGVYINVYARALMDVKDVMSKTDNKADLLACAALRAWGFSLMVDNVDEAPYTEALLGSANPMPKWDDGKTVYQGILKEMEDALAAYEASNDKMTLTDMMFNKNMNQWVGYVNALRLRLYLRMYDADNSVKDKIVALVNENKFFAGNATIDCFSDMSGNRSPFYASTSALGTGNHCAGYALVEYLKSTNDPRIAYAIAKNKDGEYVGQLPGFKSRLESLGLVNVWVNTSVSNINYALYNGTGATRPAFIYTQAELQFFIAEAKMRFMNDAAGAKAAYEAAVAADFAARGMAGAEGAILNGATTAWDNAANKLELIHMQKWVALFYMDNMEAWSELRRTDIPAVTTATVNQIWNDNTAYTPGKLIIPAGSNSTTKLMRRLPYPQVARRLNKNTPAVKTDNYQNIWWDVK